MSTVINMEGGDKKVSASSSSSSSESNPPVIKEAKPGDGLRSVRTTSLFRAVNFELFMKPNKTIMAVGLVSITSCVIYLAYMNARKENNVYRVVNADDSVSLKTRKSKWDL